MKSLIIIGMSTILLSSCNPVKMADRLGCMDRNSYSYDQYATIHDQAKCKYGGFLVVSTDSPENQSGDTTWLFIKYEVTQNKFEPWVGYSKVGTGKQNDCNHKTDGNWAVLDTGKCKCIFYKRLAGHKDFFPVSDTLVFKIGFNSCYTVRLK